MAPLPLKTSRSAPAPPMMVSLLSPGSHWNTSSPSPPSSGVDALVAVDEVVAGAAGEHVGAVAAEEGVVAVAAVDVEGDQGGEVADGGERVVAGAEVDVEQLDGGQAQLHAAGGAVDGHVGAVGDDVDGVGAGGAGHRHHVGGRGAGDVDAVGGASR